MPPVFSMTQESSKWLEVLGRQMGWVAFRHPCYKLLSPLGEGALTRGEQQEGTEILPGGVLPASLLSFMAHFLLASDCFLAHVLLFTIIEGQFLLRDSPRGTVETFIALVQKFPCCPFFLFMSGSDYRVSILTFQY